MKFAALFIVVMITSPALAQPAPARPKFDTARIEELTGAKGKLDEKEGVFKVSVPRSDLAVNVAGVRMTPPMGLTSWAAFTHSNEKAIVDGDFAMLETEMQTVLKALRGAHINVVAIHQHMTGEKPRAMFLHYWGVGPTEDLAKGLRAALAQTAHNKAGPT